MHGGYVDVSNPRQSPNPKRQDYFLQIIYTHTLKQKVILMANLLVLTCNGKQAMGNAMWVHEWN